jgi:hypothetical protein
MYFLGLSIGITFWADLIWPAGPFNVNYLANYSSIFHIDEDYRKEGTGERVVVIGRHSCCQQT